MTPPDNENWFIQYWHIISGAIVAAFAVARIAWYRVRYVDRRFVRIEERIPSLTEGKMLATKQHVDNCKEQVKKEQDDKHERVLAAINDVHKRIDELFKMLADTRQR